jgi:hypothetical protein
LSVSGFGWGSGSTPKIKARIPGTVGR